MAYNKKYAELGESVIDYVNNREDAIEQGFEDVATQMSWGDWDNLTLTGGWTGTARVRRHIGLDIVELNYDLTSPSTVGTLTNILTVPYSYSMGTYTVFPTLSTSGEVAFLYGQGTGIKVPLGSGIKANTIYRGTHIYKRVI